MFDFLRIKRNIKLTNRCCENGINEELKSEIQELRRSLHRMEGFLMFHHGYHVIDDRKIRKVE